LPGDNRISSQATTILEEVESGNKVRERHRRPEHRTARGKFEYSEEIGEGVILDIGQDGDILSIEIIDATKRLGKEVAEKVAQRYLAAA
jgi:uncharacterized protein YuzE